MTTTPEIQELDIVLNVKVKTNALDKDKGEVVSVLRDAIRHEIDRCRIRRDEFLKECQQFEDEYNFSSDEFLERFESGELGDDAPYFTWFAVKHSFDTLDRHYQILLGCSVRE